MKKWLEMKKSIGDRDSEFSGSKGVTRTQSISTDTAHKRIKTIDSLMINGVMSSNSMEIKRSIVDLYQNL